MANGNKVLARSQPIRAMYRPVVRQSDQTNSPNRKIQARSQPIRSKYMLEFSQSEKSVCEDLAHQRKVKVWTQAIIAKNTLRGSQSEQRTG